MNHKSCFFIGHREASDAIYPKLLAAVRQHIVDFHVSEFVVGHYGRFDCLAARAVIEIKREFPEVSLLMLIPYHPVEAPIEPPKGFDGTFYPPGMESVPRQFAIVRANRYMLNHSDFLIAYVRHPASNTANLVADAVSRERRGIIHITQI